MGTHTLSRRREREGERGQAARLFRFQRYRTTRSGFWLMVLRLHAPLPFSEKDLRLPAPFPCLPASSFQFFSFFLYAEIFLRSISISQPLRLFTPPFPGLPPFSSHPFLYFLQILSLPFHYQLPPIENEPVDYVTGCNAKYETLRSTVSLESKESVRDVAVCIRTRTPRNKRNTSDYAECLYMQICDDNLEYPHALY